MLGYPIIPDIYPGEGPLGGILTALEHSRDDWNLIIACDMPAVSVEFLGELLAAAERCEADALVPASPAGHMEPLCAAYHRNCRQGLHSAFRRGIRKITAAFPEIRVVTWPVSETPYFQNINTPEEWAAYER